MKLKLLLVTGLILTLMALGTVGCETLSPPASTTEAAEALSGIFSQQSTGIWVSGEGKVSVVPDVAILSLGVEAQSATVAEAQSQASTAMTAVVTELDRFGIDKKDIKTQQFSIYPVRQWSEKDAKEILIGYRVSGDFIRINSISFTVDDPSPYHKEAREKAMADAEAKAKQLADLGGVKLGKPIYINESGGYIAVERPYYGEAAPAPAMAPTPISPGETEITLYVQIVYSID
jgi:uncharacterized protein YggE